MIDALIFAFWFFLPAGVANATPVLANKVPGLNRWTTPLDFGHTWRDKRLFGANKTWRGLIFGTLIGSITGLGIYAIYSDFATQLGFMINPWQNMFLLGGLLGAGALIGDALESMVKRQIGVPPGDPWFPFDQIDYIFGGMLLALPLYVVQPEQIAAILIVYFGLHLVVSYIGYLLKLKDKPI